MPPRASTGRNCSCGGEIAVTAAMAAFGAMHGKDPKTWPQRCAYCIVDSTITMFAAIGSPPTPVLRHCINNPMVCATCDKTCDAHVKAK
jgi:hypothetical protein